MHHSAKKNCVKFCDVVSSKNKYVEKYVHEKDDYLQTSSSVSILHSAVRERENRWSYYYELFFLYFKSPIQHV